ncbi:hypothetical protein C0J52_03265 [Blattella germanica]|nr:hypothetical protein C0J52_03265 [Blattella germanica]
MKHPIFIVFAFKLVLLTVNSDVDGYVIRGSLPVNWGNDNDDYLFDLERDEIPILDPIDSKENEVNGDDISCSMEYDDDENRMTNEVPVLGLPQSSDENEIHNPRVNGAVPVNEKPDYISSSEILVSELIDSISHILKKKHNIKIDSLSSEEDDFGLEKVFTGDDGYNEADLPTFLVVEYEKIGRDASVDSSQEYTLGFDLVGSEENAADASVEWIDEDSSDDSHKVVENGYIFYDMVVVSRETYFSNFPRILDSGKIGHIKYVYVIIERQDTDLESSDRKLKRKLNNMNFGSFSTTVILFSILVFIFVGVLPNEQLMVESKALVRVNPALGTIIRAPFRKDSSKCKRGFRYLNGRCKKIY